jgi:hypothetical protein
LPASPYKPEGWGGLTEGVGGGITARGMKAALRIASIMSKPSPRQWPLIALLSWLSMTAMAAFIDSSAPGVPMVASSLALRKD